jgi:class 3 adenylate cyclase/tetratricopeptide (TPR) repeat protein
MPACPVCSQENPEIARFCLACGAALSSEPPREERKVVSVLFADLVGFTSRAEQLDPEDVRALLAPYWERLRSELEGFGGTVEKFIGDAVMALFGAPVAHEDDPERAVRAALAIRDRAREEEGLQVRIAVNTGEALVLLGARPAEGEGMAAGDVVNTAARLQSAAPVNGVLVGETTYRATRHAIEYAEREPVAAKGKAEPVPVWEALEARSRFGADVEQQALLPLVGRARELETMLGALERARREREPQLVTLVGVPGIGKSRLVAELFASLGRGPELVTWRQGRALPYGEGIGFWALTEMVKAQAGIRENDSEAEAGAKLRASVEALVQPDEREWVTEHLLPLLGLAGETPRYGESSPAWRRWLEGLAEQRPLVLVFEDLHWADDGLLDFVDHLVEWAGGVPLLVLGTARPELLDRRPGWGGGKLNAATLALSPLADEEAAQIIQGVLEQSVLPAETQRALLERAGGNPLYAEQFARLYLERGSAEDLPLPETVQGIVAARLDGLSPDEKRLVQDAAVVGKVFWAGAAAALAGLDDEAVRACLHGLERKGLVRRERRSAVAREDEYAFRHVLIRDVAYGQIPRAARVERHLAAAGWIERLGREEDHAELLAHHLGSALELRRGDAALAERARVAFWRAGRRALDLHAYRGALRFCEAALELWPEEAERARIVAAAARARFRVEGDPADLIAAVDALETAGDPEGAAETAAAAANAAWRAGRRPEAEALIARAERVLEGREPSPALAAVLAEKARLAGFVESPEAAERVTREALRLAERLDLPELRANVLCTLGNVFFGSAAYDSATRAYDEALTVAPAGSPEMPRVTANRGLIALIEGDGPETLAWLDRAAEAAARAGDLPGLAWVEAGVIIERYYKGGRWDEALTRIAVALERAERAGGTYMAPLMRMHRALMLAARGEARAAEEELDAAMVRLGGSDDFQYRAPMLLAAAQTRLLLGDEEQAVPLVAAVDEALGPPGESRVVPPLHADAVTTIARCGYGEAWGARFASNATRRFRAARLAWSGRAAEAADLYALAAPEEEAAARLLAAEQLATQGRREEAAAQLERGLAFFRAVGATRVVRGAEALFAAAS